MYKSPMGIKLCHIPILKAGLFLKLLFGDNIWIIVDAGFHISTDGVTWTKSVIQFVRGARCVPRSFTGKVE